MIRKLKVTIRGQGTVTPVPRWACVKCGRDFKLPKVPNTCETLFSICMTCFAISCVEEIDEEETESS